MVTRFNYSILGVEMRDSLYMYAPAEEVPADEEEGEAFYVVS